MSWSEQCNNEIERRFKGATPEESIADAISGAIKAHIDQALYNCGIGGMPQYDPAQDVDFYNRYLNAAIKRLVRGQ